MISQISQRTSELSKEYFKYSEYLNTLDIKNETKDWRLKHIRGFDYYLKNNGITLHNLTPKNVYDYMNSISNLSSRTKENRAVCIRYFLNFLFKEKIVKFDGYHVFPKIKHQVYSTIPSYYSDKEIKSLIKSVNRNDAFGKRDFAILLLLVTYGIRLKDLINLSYDNIHWNDNKIVIIQSKDQEINEFPLTEEIKYAILDYLKNERGNIKLPYIFLTNKNKQISSGELFNIVNKYFKKANINTYGKHHGAHSLRHSLSVSLLSNGIGIGDISKVLGHNQIETTKEYLRVDLQQLKKISLEVPKWEI